MRLLLFPVAALLCALASCAPAEPMAAPENSANVTSADALASVAPGGLIDPDISMSAADRAACKAAGGFVERRGRRNAELCVTPFPDAGKACSDGSECAGRCIVEGGAEMQPDESIVSICQRDDALFGCFSTVENGAILRGLCVD